MIDYAAYCLIKQHAANGPSSPQIATMTGLNEKTVRKWLSFHSTLARPPQISQRLCALPSWQKRAQARSRSHGRLSFIFAVQKAAVRRCYESR